jgi:hypothetical protein
LCLHNVTNGNSTLSKWNNTDCGIYEIDAYDEKENLTGFKIQDCPALLKYRKFGWM